VRSLGHITATAILASLVLAGPTPAAHPETETSASFEGAFDPQAALTLLYGAETPPDIPGHYGAKSWRDHKTLRLWRNVEVPERFAKYYPSEPTGEVYVAFDAPYSEEGIQKHIVITATMPPGGHACHACAPLIGGAVFSQSGEQWVVEAVNKYIAVMGKNGETDGESISLAKIGPSRYGVLFQGDDVHQGYMSNYVSLIVPDGQSLVEALSFFVEGPTEATLHEGTICGPNVPGGCIDITKKNHGRYKEPRIDVRFLTRDRGRAYYPVETLIEYNDGDFCGVIPTKELRVFAFERGKYHMTKKTVRRGKAFCLSPSICWELGLNSPVCTREYGSPY
jgi:hypothetical protein